MSKKENKGGSAGSPDCADSDNDLETNLTPRTEAKYNKIDEEFQIMMHRNHVNGNRLSGAGFASMPVSVPVNESQYSDNSSQHDHGVSPGHLSVGAGSPVPRPHSTGNGMQLEVPHQNGYHPASSPTLPPSHTPSPGLSNGGSPTSNANNKQKDFRATNLKVVIPNAGSHPGSGGGHPGIAGGGLLGISRSQDEVCLMLPGMLSFF